MGDLDLIPGLERSPGEEYGYPLQYSSLENFIDRGAWEATVHELDMTGSLSLNNNINIGKRPQKVATLEVFLNFPILRNDKAL